MKNILNATAVSIALLLLARTTPAHDAVVNVLPASAPAAAARPAPYRSPITVPSAADMARPAPTVSAPPNAGSSPTPAFTASCDSSGCWGSDGKRYNAAGGMLTRPDGKLCRDVAGVLQCP